MRAFLRMSAFVLFIVVFCAVSALAQELPKYNPLDDISQEMQSASGHLQKIDTGRPTQKSHKEIVHKLDVLIEELEKECKNCNGQCATNNPTKPATKSTIRSGPGGAGKMLAARQNGKDWGQLPDKERERILQSMSEGFPAHYQMILERYYKRLAEEQTVGTESAAKEEEPKATTTN
jgi:hypothetical protein